MIVTNGAPQTIWFTADTHFGEQPAKRRKATGLSANELDALIEMRWREQVSETDAVWHLGDVGKDWQRLGGLPGKKHLVFGNNDTARRRLTQSGIFASLADSHCFPAPALFLIHDPAHAGADEKGPVVHGHLHALPSPAPGFVSVSVDRHDWGPVRLGEVLSFLQI